MTRYIPLDGDRPWRLALLLSIIGLHAALLLWLATFSVATQLAPRADNGVVLISLTSPGGAAAVSPNNQSRTQAAAILPATSVASSALVEVPPPAAADASIGTVATIDGCALGHTSGQAITRDPMAMAELDALPAGIRSSADAVMLWNGQWLSLGAGPPAISVGALRRAVERVVMNAAPECRTAKIDGPQFIPIPSNGRTVTIVFGSGTWRWADLLMPMPACEHQVGLVPYSPCAPQPEETRSAGE